jgi:ATP-binding cassette, subfamily B (MDR/TAP), member 1
MVYPAFGVVFAKGISAFSLTSAAERRFQGDRNALWYVWFWSVQLPAYTSLRFFLIAIISTGAIGCQNYLFSSAAASLTARLRSLSFKAILRQDGTSFDSVYVGAALNICF